MKKIILLGACLFMLWQVNAQTKISKTSVLGKWTISSVEMPGMLYYNLEKDSLALGDMMKAQVTDAQKLTEVEAMIKPQMSVFKNVSFQFNADGTAVLAGDPVSGTQAATYSVDEAASTITTIDKDKKEDVLKADMLADKLRIILKQPQGDITMILKK